jgi:hypothetical protein
LGNVAPHSMVHRHELRAFSGLKWLPIVTILHTKLSSSRVWILSY